MTKKYLKQLAEDLRLLPLDSLLDLRAMVLEQKQQYLDLLDKELERRKKAN